MLRTCIALAAFGLLVHVAPVKAQSTVECHSVAYKYTECYAPLSQPQLVHQVSSSPCIINRTWGFNRKTRHVWVAEGCAGVFADSSGYHHGSDGTYDKGSRSYDNRGHDVGALVAGALILGALSSDSNKKEKHHTYSNYDYDTHSYKSKKSGYDGCHGIGCMVDNPGTARDDSQEIDTRPQFDKQGNPNFDTKGNYQGCHGVGCDVDPPADDSSNDDSDDSN